MSINFIPGIATQSLGCPSRHPLIPKLHAAAEADMQSVEIFYEDVSNLTESVIANPHLLPSSFQILPAGSSFSSSSTYQETEIAVCSYIASICASLSMSIICLQPFMHYEGLLSRDEHASRISKLRYWIQLAHRLGTDLIQIPSSFLSADQLTTSQAQIIQDLQEAADIGLSSTPPIRFAYEALAWGTNTCYWDAAFDIVLAVDRPNFGTCLDSFNLAGRVYADPKSEDGRVQDADTAIARSLAKLRRTLADPVNLAKVFYVELCDGERLDRPLDEKHELYEATQPARMTWSRNARLYPFETDAEEAKRQSRGVGYLPVTDVLDVVLEAGYTGYLSFEVFNRSLNQEGEHVVEEHMKRTKTSWQRCCEYIDRKVQEIESQHVNTDHEQQQQRAATSLSISKTGIIDFGGISSRL